MAEHRLEPTAIPSLRALRGGPRTWTRAVLDYVREPDAIYRAKVRDSAADFD